MMSFDRARLIRGALLFGACLANCAFAVQESRVSLQSSAGLVQTSKAQLATGAEATASAAGSGDSGSALQAQAPSREGSSSPSIGALLLASLAAMGLVAARRLGR